MKRKRSSQNSHTTDLCGSFLVNVLDLSKILNGKNKSKTVHKLTCLKELLELSPGSTSSSSSPISDNQDDNTIVISDSESEDKPMNSEIVNEMPQEIGTEIKSDSLVQEDELKIKKETLFDHKKVSRFKKVKKRTSSCSDESDDDEKSEISKIKNYVKESLLQGLAINSHKLKAQVKQEPVELDMDDEEPDVDNAPVQEPETASSVLEKCDIIEEDKKVIKPDSKKMNSTSVTRKHIRLTNRRNSSYQGKRLLRHYRNLKKRPRLSRLIELKSRTNSKPKYQPKTQEIFELSEPENEEEISSQVEYFEVDHETKETGVQVQEMALSEEETIPVEETLPSSTTNDQEISALSKIEELKVQITEDETTVYITILDGSTSIPDVLQVLRCSTPDDAEIGKIIECDDEILNVVDIEDEENPYFSQLEYKSCYTNASSTTGTNVKTLYGIITYPEVKKNLINAFGSQTIPNKKGQKTESPYSYKTINDSVYTLAPTNCNYINHVHWTNTYPLSFVTNDESHKHLCVLKELYAKDLHEDYQISHQPIEMRCNAEYLPKSKNHQSEMPKTTMENSYPYIPPITTSYFPYNYNESQSSTSSLQRHSISTFSSSSYSCGGTSTVRRNTMPLAQPVNVSYARKYMDQQQYHHSNSKQQNYASYQGHNRYGYQTNHHYKQQYGTSNKHSSRHHHHRQSTSYQTNTQPQQSLSFIDIPIHTPGYNIKIPPLRIPITAIAPQLQQQQQPAPPQNACVSPSSYDYSYSYNSNNRYSDLAPIAPVSPPYHSSYHNFNSNTNNYNNYNNYNLNHNNYHHPTPNRYQYSAQSPNIMKNLLQMEPKSRFVWS
uniref:CSON004699 protein n=1 Tax=Culicoides sonorensis TaxID=179676 RepID=A0A336LTV1_CULSO